MGKIKATGMRTKATMVEGIKPCCCQEKIPSTTAALVRMPVALTYPVYNLTLLSQATSHNPTIFPSYS